MRFIIFYVNIVISPDIRRNIHKSVSNFSCLLWLVICLWWEKDEKQAFNEQTSRMAIFASPGFWMSTHIATAFRKSFLNEPFGVKKVRKRIEWNFFLASARRRAFASFGKRNQRIASGLHLPTSLKSHFVHFWSYRTAKYVENKNCFPRELLRSLVLCAKEETKLI